MPAIGGIGAGEALTVQWGAGLHALMAFLQPDLLVDRLMDAINQIANTPCPLAEREQQIAELDREIDRLQRIEEVFVTAALAAGFSVHRSPSAPPAASAGRQGRGQGLARRLINEDAARILPVFSGRAASVGAEQEVCGLRGYCDGTARVPQDNPAHAPACLPLCRARPVHMAAGPNKATKPPNLFVRRAHLRSF